MFATALALVTFAAAPVPKGAEKDAAAALQGEWRVVALVRNGATEPADAGALGCVTFADDTVRFRTRAFHETGTFTAARNAPAHIDIVLYDEGDDAVGVPAVGGPDDSAYAGLYTLDRNELTIYLVKGRARPKTIPSADKTAKESVLLVLERVKK